MWVNNIPPEFQFTSVQVPISVTTHPVLTKTHQKHKQTTFMPQKKVQRKGYKSTLKVPILEAKLVGSSASTSYAAVRVNGLSMLKFMRRTCNNIRDRTAFSYIQFQYKMIITNYNPLLVYNLILCFVKNNMRWMSKKNIAKILNLNKYDKIYSWQNRKIISTFIIEDFKTKQNKKPFKTKP